MNKATEISPEAFEAARWMQDRIELLRANTREMPMSLAQKLNVMAEIKMVERDRRRLLGVS